jgi:dTDP-4-amino-4,6-dideoxygalactose transaminase/lipid II:glycine glycyltransferase (peptidoglycan interpeptide bridge formation enzyme)
MNIFNSLGSNYDFSAALRILFSSGGNAKSRELVAHLEKRYGGKAILTYKGREALTLALSALPEKGGVAMNGFTCLAVYEAVLGSGNTVRYLDIAEHALDFSFETLTRAVETDKNIRAVIVQNTLGNPCDIVPITKLCKERGMILIEDLAHSIGTRYASGIEAGTVGDFVILSFSQDKVVDAVSGGALIVRNKKYADIAVPSRKIPLSQQLKDRLYPMLTWKIRLAYALGIGKPYHAFLRYLGILSRPLDESPGPRALPDWYCANILRQFRALENVARHRREIAEIYARHLDAQFLLPLRPERSANLRFPILTDGRERLIEYLRDRHIRVSDIWYDAPVAPKKYLHRTNYAGQCPQAEKISETILNLPTHINVSARDARVIAEAVNEWRAHEAGEYKITAVTDENEWEGFLQKLQPHSFLQSWKWGEHNEQTGSKIFRVGAYRKTDLVAVGSFIKIEARRGSFLLCPHGPVFANGEGEAALLRVLADECVRIARAEKCDFIRFCPLSSPETKTAYRRLGFKNAPIHMHPEVSWMLDITKPESELLKDMRKTTRYLVKKMEKEGVEITGSKNPDDIEKFWPVYRATVERQHFTPFRKEALKKEFELFAKDDQAAFFFGTQNGKVVAAAIIIFYNGQAFYHHSGSLSSGSNVSYLLQWRVIQEAKRRGCTLYNFWGISPADRPNHPWAGLSLFKKGFGGFAEEYLHAQDKPITAQYAVNYAVETARRIKRGL